MFGLPGMGGANPAQIKALMKQMGIKTEDILAERVIIESPRGIKKVYRFRDVWTKPIFAEAEKQYQSYLKKIIEAKTKEGTNLLVGTESR